MNDNRLKNSGCLLAFFPGIFGGKGKAEPESLPYRTRDDFLSAAESSFYHVLTSVVKEQAIICPKVGLEDIFFVGKSDKRRSFLNSINAKHVDFLLCDAKTLKPLAAIELDDASHKRADREERDEFVDRVFEAAGLPLVHFKTQGEYNPRELASDVLPLLSKQSVPPVAIPARPLASGFPAAGATKAAFICPKCGILMALRTAKSGANAGKRFYGCPNYPKCREMLPAE